MMKKLLNIILCLLCFHFLTLAQVTTRTLGKEKKVYYQCALSGGSAADFSIAALFKKNKIEIGLGLLNDENNCEYYKICYYRRLSDKRLSIYFGMQTHLLTRTYLIGNDAEEYKRSMNFSLTSGAEFYLSIGFCVFYQPAFFIIKKPDFIINYLQHNIGIRFTLFPGMQRDKWL